MHKKILLIIFYMYAIIFGLLVGFGLKKTEEVGRQNQSMTDPVPKPIISLPN